MQFRKIRAMCVLAVYALLCVASISAAQQNAVNSRGTASVNNRDVIRMTKAQFDDATIVKTILAFNTDLDVSVAGLMELKEAGVTQTVIQAMLAKTAEVSKTHTLERASSPAEMVLQGSSTPQVSAATIPDATSSHHPYPELADHVNREERSKSPKDPQPRVFLESASRGSNRNAARDQSMEMAKDLLKFCSVKITINQSAADYTIRLNHIEHGLLYRDNQIELYDGNGELMRNKEGGSIKKNVQQACDTIRVDWSRQAPN